MSSEIISAVRNLFESNILEHMYAICSLTPIIAVIGPNKQWKRSCARLDLYAQPSRRNVVNLSCVATELRGLAEFQPTL